MMRILIVHWHAEVIGGMEKEVGRAIRGFSQKGHIVGLLHQLPASSANPLFAAAQSHWCASELGSAEALRQIDRWQPDVVYLHHWEDSLIEDALLTSYPCALFQHDHSRSCPTGNKAHFFPVIQPCERVAGPACLLVHYPRRCGGLNPVTAWRRYRLQSDQLARAQRYQAVVVASRSMRNELEACGIDRGRIQVVPLLPEGKPDAAAPPARPISGRLFMAARLVEVKGARTLIQAIPLAERALGRRLQLAIAGSGPEEQAILALARKTGTEVQCKGWLDESGVEAELRNCDLLVFPSLWPEPFGLLGLEAAYRGVPAVGYASGGTLDWLIPGVTGELAPADPPSPEGLAAAIVRALTDAGHLQSLREGAWRNAVDLSATSQLDRLENILSSLCGGSPR